MKVLCVIPWYWPAFRYGGPIFSIHNINKALVGKGVDVTVYTTNVGLGEKVPVNKEVNVDGVKVTYFAFTKFFEFLGQTGWQFSWSMTNVLKKNLKTFDIIHICAIWNYTTAVTAYYCRRYKKPYIITSLGSLYPYTIGKKAWKKWAYYYLIAKRDLEGAIAIRYTTHDESEKCHTFLRLNSHAIVIPEGVDISEFENLPPKENLRERYPILRGKKVVLFLGRINWIKGLDTLVKVCSMLAKERNDIHLLIVGKDDGDGYVKKVKKWIIDYKMSYVDYSIEQGDKGKIYRVETSRYDENIKVIFTGMLTGDERLEAFAGSDIFVLPSYSENFGMAVVEAMACSIPVVISNKVGIYKELEENNAGIIVETNPESLYNGLRTLLDDERLRKKIAENGRRFVEDYCNIDKVADMMIKAYEEVLRDAG